ncbi:MAG: hypothetical protein ACYC0X_05955 [Pirellulaceae bacterium]
MSIELGQPVTIPTPAGPVAGRVVGLEDRDPSRHGTGKPTPFVCVALPDPSTPWLWVPAGEVTR